jgi:hypothetical protein
LSKSSLLPPDVPLHGRRFDAKTGKGLGAPITRNMKGFVCGSKEIRQDQCGLRVACELT